MTDKLFDIAKAVHVRRVGMQISTRELAERSGLDIDTTREIATKGSREPALLSRIAEVLGCHVSELDPDILQPVETDAALMDSAAALLSARLASLFGEVDRFSNLLQPSLGYKPDRKQTLVYLLAHAAPPGV